MEMEFHFCLIIAQ